MLTPGVGNVNRKVSGVAITCPDKRRRILVHILNEGNAACLHLHLELKFSHLDGSLLKYVYLCWTEFLCPANK